MRILTAIAVVAASSLLAGCATAPGLPAQHDYEVPRVIVVLPPLNETADAQASDRFLSTVTTALAEHGYYVIPIVVVDRMMKENGLPTPGEMHAVVPAKLAEVFGADAALYIRITYWGATVGGSAVTAHYRLVDCRTGSEIWSRTHTTVETGDNSSLAAILINTAIGIARGPSQQQLRLTNAQAFMLGDGRLLKGPHHPEYEAERAFVRGDTSSD